MASSCVKCTSHFCPRPGPVAQSVASPTAVEGSQVQSRSGFHGDGNNFYGHSPSVDSRSMWGSRGGTGGPDPL